MTCCASVAPRPPCSGGQPRQVHPASARCRFHATRSACASCSRPGPPASRRAAKRPVRLAASHSRISCLNCSSYGLERNSVAPCDGPAGPQGGLQARGSSVAGQQCPPRVGSAYQALASLEGTWWSSPSRPLSQARRGSSATAPPSLSRGARESAITSYFSGRTRSRGHSSPRAWRTETGWQFGLRIHTIGFSPHSAHCPRAAHWFRSAPGSPGPRRSM